MPGQPVLFHWKTGLAGLWISGGRFGRGQVLGSGEWATDRPKKTTVYRVTWGAAQAPRHGPHGAHTAAGAAHSQTLTAEVLAGKYPEVATYFGKSGWTIDYPKGWLPFPEDLPDPAHNALIYLQTEADSPDRVAVSLAPATAATSADLMHQVMVDAPTHYDVIKDVEQKRTWQGSNEATYLTFQGLDRSNPEIPIKSVVLNWIEDKVAIVVSARTRLSRFDEDVPMLRSLVRSFQLRSHLDPRIVPHPAEPAKPPAAHPAKVRRKS